MSLTHQSQKRNRVYVRKFDYEEARRRHAAGESMSSLAREFGVSPVTIKRAIDVEFRERFDAQSHEYMKNGRCPDCGAKATRHGRLKQSRCRACWAKEIATSVRGAALQCISCREWKPDEGFPYSRLRAARRGRHNNCRACQATLRQQSRLRRRVPCRDCRELCTHPKEGGSGRCRACYLVAVAA